MSKGKDYPTLNMMLPLIAGSIDCQTNLTMEVPITQVPTMYLHLNRRLPDYRGDGKCCIRRLIQLIDSVKQFKDVVKSNVGGPCKNGSNILDILYVISGCRTLKDLKT